MSSTMAAAAATYRPNEANAGPFIDGWRLRLADASRYGAGNPRDRGNG